MVVQLSVSKKYPFDQIISEFGKNLTSGVNLAQFTGYKTGGSALYFLPVSNAIELANAVKTAQKLEIPFFVLGGGTNILVSDDGFDGLVIKININELEKISDNEIKCGAGVPLSDLIDFATSCNLTGLEFAAGIYGTLGGAIYGNAGAYGGDIGSIVKSITIVSTTGEITEVAQDYCGFAYRDSKFKQTKDIIVEATLVLSEGKKELIQTEIDRILKARNQKLPANDKSAGCFFKNIPDKSEKHGKKAAGQLLDQAGAQKLTVGGACVSPEHANIIINKGQATSKEISQLADNMKQAVVDKFGITLDEEVIRVGKF